MKAQSVYENLKFERGIDPKKALNIGIGEHFQELEKLADFFGFQRKPSPYPEAFFMWYKKDVGKLHYIKDERLNKDPYYFIVEPYESGERYFENVDNFLDKKKWEEVFRIKLKESQNFEREINPKKSMKIGLSKNEKDVLEISDFSGLNRDLQQVINDYVESKDPHLGKTVIRAKTKLTHDAFYNIDFLTNPIKNREWKYLYYDGKFYNLFPFLKEEISFERRRDPKSSMGIGLTKKIINGLWGFQQERGVGSINLVRMESVEIKKALEVIYYADDGNISEKMDKNLGLDFFAYIQRGSSGKISSR